MKTVKVTNDKSGIIQGAIKAGETISTTLGPYGKTVFISDNNGVITTKDGVTVAKAINFEDSMESIGSTVLKAVALKTNERAGDGTTTASVLATELLKNNHLEDGYKGKIKAKKLTDDILKVIDKYTKKDVSIDDLYNVAFVSSNGDEEIASLVKEVFKDMNVNTRVIVEEGYQKTLVRTSTGVALGRGFLSPYPVERYDNPQVVYEDAYILLYDGKIKKPPTIFQALNIAKEDGKPLVIVAEEVSSDVLSILAKAHRDDIVKSVVVMSPGVDYTRMEMLEDISFITGAKIYSPQKNNIRREGLGKAELVKVDRYSATAVNSNVNKEHLANRIKKIQEKIDNGDFETEWHERKQKERIASLSGKVVRILVGGDTPEEKEEKRYRIEDAINSAHTALKEGMVEGGGVIWLRIAKDLEIEFPKAVVRTILTNANVDNVDSVIDKMMSLDNFSYELVENDNGVTVDIDTNTDMFQKGIVDSVVAAKEAAKAALSIAGLFATVGNTIINEDDGIINY